LALRRNRIGHSEAGTTAQPLGVILTTRQSSRPKCGRRRRPFEPCGVRRYDFGSEGGLCFQILNRVRERVPSRASAFILIEHPPKQEPKLLRIHGPRLLNPHRITDANGSFVGVLKSSILADASSSRRWVWLFFCPVSSSFSFGCVSVVEEVTGGTHGGQASRVLPVFRACLPSVSNR